jgi:hypothetical protein
MQDRQKADVQRTNLIKAKLLEKMVGICGYVATKWGAEGDIAVIIFGELPL